MPRVDTIWAICRRDTIAAFTTPLAWLVLACWTALVNGMFVLGLYSIHGTAGSDVPLFVSSLRLGSWLLLLLAPAITMTSFAGERAQGTLQLLLTLPIHETHIIIGKFFAACAVIGSLIIATLLLPLVLMFISDIQIPHLLAGYLGLVFIGAWYAALGIWISLLVDSPVAAYVLTFGAIAVFHLIGLIGTPSSAFESLSTTVGIGPRLAPFFNGEIRLSSVAYFLGGISAALALAHHALRAKRWRG